MNPLADLLVSHGTMCSEEADRDDQNGEIFFSYGQLNSIADVKILVVSQLRIC